MASKHGYELVAKAINRVATDETPPIDAHKMLDRIVDEIADEFARDNIRFSRYRFMAACGYNAER